MKRNYKQILNDLPKDWSEFTYGQFNKISQVTITEVDELFIGQENTLKTLNVLTHIPLDELRSASYDVIIPLANKISFTGTIPEFDSKHQLKWKKIDKVSYNNYVNFLNLSKDPITNLGNIIKEFSISELSDEEIEQLSMLEVYSSFFTLSKYVTKYFRTTINRSILTLVKQLIQECLMLPFKQRFRNRKRK